MCVKYKNVFIPIMVVIVYLVFFWMAGEFLFSNGLLISLSKVNSNNVLLKLIEDISISIILPIIIIFINRKNLEKLYINRNNIVLFSILLLIYIVFFILHKDYSIGGLYKAFFYLIIVATSEEIINRGYFYLRLKDINKYFAIVVSGSLFGIMHAILPGILNEQSVAVTLLSMTNYIGGGILGAYMFISLLELSKTILVPILIHALLDYSFGYWGLVVTILTFLYLIIKKRIIKQDMEY